MDINIGKGIEDIFFGQTENQLVNIYGAPDKQYILDSDDICYEYNNLQFAINFDSEDNNRVCWIDIRNKDTKVLGYYLWDKSKKDILEIFERLWGVSHILNDYGSLESVEFEEYGLEFQFVLGRLTSINIGYLFDDNGLPIW